MATENPPLSPLPNDSAGSSQQNKAWIPDGPQTGPWTVFVTGTAINGNVVMYQDHSQHKYVSIRKTKLALAISLTFSLTLALSIGISIFYSIRLDEKLAEIRKSKALIETLRLEVEKAKLDLVDCSNYLTMAMERSASILNETISIEQVDLESRLVKLSAAEKSARIQSSLQRIAGHIQELQRQQMATAEVAQAWAGFVSVSNEYYRKLAMRFDLAFQSMVVVNRQQSALVKDMAGFTSGLQSENQRLRAELDKCRSEVSGDPLPAPESPCPSQEAYGYVLVLSEDELEHLEDSKVLMKKGGAFIPVTPSAEALRRFGTLLTFPRSSTVLDLGKVAGTPSIRLASIHKFFDRGGVYSVATSKGNAMISLNNPETFWMISGVAVVEVH